MNRGEIMENRKAIYMFGLIFSIVFAIIYYMLFQTFLAQKPMQYTIYYHQIGLYQSNENAEKAIKQFQEQDIDAYLYKVNDMNSVICGLSESKEEAQKYGEALKKKQIPYVDKMIQSQNEAVHEALEKKDYTTALELIHNESKGNEQTGATSRKSTE